MAGLSGNVAGAAAYSALRIHQVSGPSRVEILQQMDVYTCSQPAAKDANFPGVNDGADPMSV